MCQVEVSFRFLDDVIGGVVGGVEPLGLLVKGALVHRRSGAVETRIGRTTLATF